MKKVAVVFKSKYGSTEKYAKWIAEDTCAEIFKVSEIKADKLEEFDTIVYCGGLYAGGILGFSFIKNNYYKFYDKKLIVVAVGATLKKDEAIEEIKEQNLTDEMKGNVQIFLLRGGLNYKKMNFIDRLLMFLLIKSVKLKKAEELDDDTKGMIATYGQVVDFTNRNTIAPIINDINN
ncbi:flavodoxin domain-containing protein [Lutispora sp.]|uniref:flavodoxin domain-containing protein n=1 Tax=Lutispora sp. TaxID=2828727 RepID=UPI00356970A6